MCIYILYIYIYITSFLAPTSSPLFILTGYITLAPNHAAKLIDQETDLKTLAAMLRTQVFLRCAGVPGREGQTLTNKKMGHNYGKLNNYGTNYGKLGKHVK